MRNSVCQSEARGEMTKAPIALQELRKRCAGHIGFLIDGGRFLRSAWQHRLQQRLQYLLQSFAAAVAERLLDRGWVTPPLQCAWR